jgi:ParB family transcriptional regulator, chromosome partitioning protein
MTNSIVPAIPIAEIHISNPRPRNKHVFDQIVTSISTLGLKTPITVAERKIAPDGTRYDLVCGQGRLEAFLALGETKIPAIIITASREDQFLMSLIENIARRPPSQHGLLDETKRLRGRGYGAEEIAAKLGFTSRYIESIVMLVENGEMELIRLVEASKIPLSVAIEIATGTSAEIQRVLAEAYESGDLRGKKLRVARTLIRKRLTATKSKARNLPLKPRSRARLSQRNTRNTHAFSAHL